MGHWFSHGVVGAGRLPLFCFFVAFIVTFVVVRVNVRLIRGNVRWWFKNVQVGDLHIHHVVFGVVLMLVGGVAGFATPESYVGWHAIPALVFGTGSALVLDEFALILHLRDVYWTEAGRTSVDAVFVAIALTGLLLLGIRPVGFGMVAMTNRDGWLDPAILFGFYTVSLIINLTLAVITVLKGKIWTGLIGLFVPVLLVPGAIRLARPVSPWARWLYPPASRKARRALRRDEVVHRPIVRVKIWCQELIAGRHDLVVASGSLASGRVDRERDALQELNVGGPPAD